MFGFIKTEQELVIISCSLFYVVFIIMAILLLKLNIKPNRWFGVRVPWTMHDKDIWKKTQIFSGKVMIIGSLLSLLLIYFLRWSTSLVIFISFFISILIMASIQVGYSMKVYKMKYGTLKIRQQK